METSQRLTEEQQVLDKAGRLSGLIQKSIDWSRAHIKQVQIRTFLGKTLQGKTVVVRKIQDSAARPIALGVFGASQCGKSYLVSELVRGSKKALSVFLNAPQGNPEIRDYLEEVNPAGGRESTAIVTRFTKRPYREVPGCSAHLRLLSRVDLIKILLNGFLFECQSDFTPAAEDLQKLRFSFRGATRRPDEEPSLTEEDIWELQDYVKRHFRNQFLKMLEDINYWGILNDEIRLLPFEQQVLYLEWLWGKFPKLTELYKYLHRALGNNGNQVVGLYQDALIPRDKSLIDVQRLSALMKAGNRKCAIVTSGGQIIEMDTSVMCALACELILKVPEDPQSMLNEMDVLDFPGARSRAQSFDNAKLSADPLALSEVYLRGKVAYLFDRYSDDRDITGLILCQEGGPQEAKSLPYMVNKWVEWSHGTEPKTRAGKPVMLFQVFTKFDLDLVRKKGEDPQVRWESRLKTNFGDFFGRAGEWVYQWDETSAFRNCFWVRNPNVQQTVFGKDKNGAEFIQDENQLAEIKKQYCEHEMVRRHFSNPEEAWNEAATPGHAGIDFLVSRIRKTIEPNAKVKQLAANLMVIFDEVRAHLNPYYIGDDVTKGRALAEERAKKRVAALGKVMATRYALPLILDRDRLSVSEKTIAMIYDSVVNPMLSDESGTAPGSGPAATSKPIFDDSIFGTESVAPEKPEEKQKAAPVKKGDQFAKAVLDRWQEQLIHLTNDPEFQQKVGLDVEWFADLSQELIKGASRQDLYQRISDESDVRLNSPNPMKFMRMQASSTTAMINRFACDLGQSVKERSLPGRAPKVTLSAKAYPGLSTYQHWTSSFIELFKNNVAEASKGDEEANRQLKGILDSNLA